MKITSGLRPGNYNNWINGAINSMHKVGGALDFQPETFKTLVSLCHARTMIEEFLDVLGLRMEKLPMSNWIHIDTKDPGPEGRRYFVP